ncbi:MAG: Rab family GTPase [Promethearchaeota archaeon]
MAPQNIKLKKNPNLIYKIILAGAGGSGKTTLLRSKLAKKFITVSDITIGIDFDCYKIMNYKEEDVDLLAFDLGGQEHFRFIHSAFTRGSKAAIIMYDLTRLSTVHSIPHWIALVQANYPSIPIVLAGSKRDLVDRETMVEFDEEIQRLIRDLPAETNLIDHVMFTSHSMGEINQVFTEIQKLAVSWKNQILAPKSLGIESTNTI